MLIQGTLLTKSVVAKFYEGKTHRPYECTICKISVESRSGLKYHVKSVHEGKKPFKCVICDSFFQSKALLKRHVSHVHEKNTFKCNICGVMTEWKHNLSKHMISVHEEKKGFKCPDCDAKFSLKETLNQQISSHYYPFECDLCNKTFSRKFSLKKHVNSTHK